MGIQDQLDYLKTKQYLAEGERNAYAQQMFEIEGPAYDDTISYTVQDYYREMNDQA